MILEFLKTKTTFFFSLPLETGQLFYTKKFFSNVLPAAPRDKTRRKKRNRAGKKRTVLVSRRILSFHFSLATFLFLPSIFYSSFFCLFVCVDMRPLSLSHSVSLSDFRKIPR